MLSAFKLNVPISIQAWSLLKHTGHTLGLSLSTDVPKCLIGYNWYLRLLASHRLDPCEALDLGSVCSQKLHGNMGPCKGVLNFLHLLDLILAQLTRRYVLKTAYHRGTHFPEYTSICLHVVFSKDWAFLDRSCILIH